jgi:hypothetical protein
MQVGPRNHIASGIGFLQILGNYFLEALRLNTFLLHYGTIPKIPIILAQFTGLIRGCGLNLPTAQISLSHVGSFATS